jgi:hypothetical protein
MPYNTPCGFTWFNGTPASSRKPSFDSSVSHALHTEKGTCSKPTFQRSNLISRHRRQFLQTHLDLSPAETLDIRQTGMSADFDVVLLAFGDRVHHDQRVAGVEAAGDVGVVDQFDQFVV